MVSTLLAATPAFAAPVTVAPPLGGGKAALRVPAGNQDRVEVLSDGKVVATVELPQGSWGFQADRMNSADGVMTLSGHVLVSVTQGGQSLCRINADEARVTLPPVTPQPR